MAFIAFMAGAGAAAFLAFFIAFMAFGALVWPSEKVRVRVQTTRIRKHQLPYLLQLIDNEAEVLSSCNLYITIVV